MSHPYRCSRCRTRNRFAKPIEDYVRKVPACRHCGYTRFYVDREKINRPTCHCAGYHYHHRPGSPCCELNPNGWRNAALRAGADPKELAPAAPAANAPTYVVRRYPGRPPVAVKR